MAAIDKFSRSRYFSTNIVDSINECDLPFSGFHNYEFKDPFTFYTLKDTDIQRPDLISYKLFSKPNYWWILMKLNNIEDIWNDLEVGLVLSVPSEQDIQNITTFMQQEKKKYVRTN
jgi:hypothetical protein